jgi:hypothetical protein
LDIRVYVGVGSDFELDARECVPANHLVVALVHLVSEADIAAARIYWQDNARCAVDKLERAKTTVV